MTNGVPAPEPTAVRNIERKEEEPSVNDNKKPSNESSNKKPTEVEQQKT